MKDKLFTKKNDAERRLIRSPVFLNAAESATIKHAAEARHLPVSEYFRRTALGKRTDVHYEMEIVLQLGKIVQTIRDLHADLVERGIEPTAEELRPVIDEAIAAMLRIEK